jgi:DNA polymerase
MAVRAHKRPPDVPGAEAFLPGRHVLPALREAVQTCHGCTLYREATQAVFGEGSPAARVVLIGEVPGDSEDLAGKPFVGPAVGCSTRRSRSPTSRGRRST